MALIDLDKFVASFITEMKECSQMRNFSIPRCIKKALEDQGLEYKDGEIVKSQRRVSAEFKESGYGEPEDERIRKAIHIYLDWLDGRNKDYQPKGDYSIKDMIDWLEKQGKKSIWSKDDEERFQSCLNILQVQAKGFMGITETINTKWLKSLKQRYTWKPGDEQMEALEHFIIHHNGSTNYAKDLEELRIQLKKLKGE